METQLAITLADGLEHNAHAVPDIVAYHSPHKKQSQHNTDRREDEVQVVDLFHWKCATEGFGGDINEVFDDNSGQSAQNTDEHTES